MVNGLSLSFEVRLQTDFHQNLVTEEWLRNLATYLSSVGPLRSKNFHCVVASRYNESRYMGPESVAKYRFILTLEQIIEEYPLCCTYALDLEFRPRDHTFKRLSFENQYAWRVEPSGTQEELTQLLLSEGVMIPLSLTLETIDEKLLTTFDNLRTDSFILGVAQDDDQVFALFEDIRCLDAVQSYVCKPTTPVTVSGCNTEEIVKHFLGEMIAIDEAYVPHSEILRFWNDAKEEVDDLPRIDGEYFRVPLR